MLSNFKNCLLILGLLLSNTCLAGSSLTARLVSAGWRCWAIVTKQCENCAATFANLAGSKSKFKSSAPTSRVTLATAALGLAGCAYAKQSSTVSVETLPPLLSTDFDAEKFQAIREKWSKQLAAEAAQLDQKVNLTKADLELIGKTTTTAKASENYLFESAAFKDTGRVARFHPTVLKHINEVLKTAGLNPDKIVIYAVKRPLGMAAQRNGLSFGDLSKQIDLKYFDESWAMQTIASLVTPDKHCIMINAALFDCMEPWSDWAHSYESCIMAEKIGDKAPFGFSHQHDFDSYLLHEACHIYHEDTSVRAVLKLKGVLPVLYQEICCQQEKRADITAVLSSPNPLVSAIKTMRETCPGYAHSGTAEWQELIADIKSCYRPAFLAEYWQKRVRRSFFGIEHALLSELNHPQLPFVPIVDAR